MCSPKSVEYMSRLAITISKYLSIQSHAIGDIVAAFR